MYCKPNNLLYGKNNQMSDYLNFQNEREEKGNRDICCFKLWNEIFRLQRIDAIG